MWLTFSAILAFQPEGGIIPLDHIPVRIMTCGMSFYVVIYLRAVLKVYRSATPAVMWSRLWAHFSHCRGCTQGFRQQVLRHRSRAFPAETRGASRVHVGATPSVLPLVYITCSTME